MAKQRSCPRQSIRQLIHALAFTRPALCSLPASALEDLGAASLRTSCSNSVTGTEPVSGAPLQTRGACMKGYFAARGAVVVAGERPSDLRVRAVKTSGNRQPGAAEGELAGSDRLPVANSLMDLAAGVAANSRTGLPSSAGELVEQVLEQHFHCGRGQRAMERMS